MNTFFMTLVLLASIAYGLYILDLHTATLKDFEKYALSGVKAPFLLVQGLFGTFFGIVYVTFIATMWAVIVGLIISCPLLLLIFVV